MNRLIGSVYIVDSGGLWLTSNSASSGSFLDMVIQSINFVSGTSGNFEISVSSDTAGGVIARCFNANDYSSIFMDFPMGLKVDDKLFVKTCVAGTAFLYLM